MSTLWLQNLACYSVQILIVVVAGASVRALLRLTEPRLVLRFWQVLLGICLGLPFLQPWQPYLSRNLGEQVTASLAAGRILADSRIDWLAGLSAASLVATLVVLGVLVRLVWMGAGVLRLRALKRRAVWLSASGLPVSDCREARQACFYVTSELQRPATFGISEPVVLLPVRALELDEGQLRSILLHELEHIRGRDWPLAIFEELVRSVFWFHPAVFWLVGRIRLAREQVIDARVIRHTGGRRPYLQALLEMARSGAGAELVSASSFLSPHELTERATLIMKEPHMSRKRLFVAVAVLIPLVAVSTVAAVWAFPLKGVSPSSDMTLSGQESPSGEAGKKIVKKTLPVYPPDARAKGIQGAVVLHVKVDRAGKVTEVKATEGHELLRQAAVDAVTMWEFKPVVKDGQTVPFETDITVNFVLNGDGKKSGGGVPGGGQGQGVSGGVPDLEHPQVLERSIPEYPLEAKEQKIQGKVKLEVIIDEKGQLSEARFVEGPEVFKDSALNAVKTWKWTPATKFGRPVSSKAEISLNYKLK